MEEKYNAETLRYRGEEKIYEEGFWESGKGTRGAGADAGRQDRFDGCSGSAGMAGAVVGKFYRSIKRPMTIRVDVDVLAWLKRQGRGYQTRINKLLREAMEGKRRRM